MVWAIYYWDMCIEPEFVQDRHYGEDKMEVPFTYSIGLNKIKLKEKGDLVMLPVDGFPIANKYEIDLSKL
jgi:hypothetical protein